MRENLIFTIFTEDTFRPPASFLIGVEWLRASVVPGSVVPGSVVPGSVFIIIGKQALDGIGRWVCGQAGTLGCVDSCTCGQAGTLGCVGSDVSAAVGCGQAATLGSVSRRGQAPILRAW